MILVDANVLMYAAGADHPNKAASVRYLQAVADGSVDGVLDAATLQEILHRYRAIGHSPGAAALYENARRIFPMVLPITAEVLDVAHRLLDEAGGISARDALHAAVVESYELEGICSYDRGFDRLPGLGRVEPDAPAGG